MPELPEVETIARQLSQVLVDRRIERVEVFYDRMILSPLDEFKATLTNRVCKSVKRRGKFLLIEFSDSWVLISHLRMEGKYLLFAETEESPRHTRVLFHLDDGHKLCYDDSRKFGIMKLLRLHELAEEPMLTSLGPEPFDLTDAASLYHQAKKIKKPIKSLLLDQHFLAGLGNIYVDETLYRAKINPFTLACFLTLDDWNRILEESQKVLKLAIKAGGTTIRSYHPSRNMDGRFQNNLLVYGKKGELCSDCHHPFRKTVLGGRGTTYCPTCQIRKGKPTILGITGVIGSGKSTACHYLASLGADVCSADAIIDELYQTPAVIKHLQRLVAEVIIVDGKLDRDALRHAFLDVTQRQKMEAYLHPLVKEEMRRFEEQSSAKVIVLEIPLLFEAGFDDLCDQTLAIKINNKDQMANLQKRHQGDIAQMLTLNYHGDDYPYRDRLTYYLDTKNNKKGLQEALKHIYQNLVNR